jgi:putative acetyltransferase
MSKEQDTAGVRVRLATADDAPSIASVLQESFIEYKSLYTPEGYAATALEAEQVLLRIEEGPVWVAEANDAVVGTASAVPKADGVYVRGMAILPAARGLRLGEMLLNQIERYAAERGFARLYLSTTPFLDRAIKLYERYGFRRSGEGPDNLHGTPLFSMEKFLESVG